MQRSLHKNHTGSKLFFSCVFIQSEPIFEQMTDDDISTTGSEDIGGGGIFTVIVTRQNFNFSVAFCVKDLPLFTS